MEKDNYHRLNNDPDVIDGFSRTLPEIEWLTLVLILFYLTVGDVEETVKPLLILASCLFAIVIIVFQYINFFNESKEWKISVQTWLMILYISYVLWYSGKLDSPLFNLYLLPIIASAITLDKLATFLKTGLIGLTMLYFQSSEANEGILPSLTESGELLLL
ncbi:MAG: GGDEF domain-containing protein, partial [Gammaproteobacteria bacterium]|nr:GGDEF domain-containing protein [Gammaproteobacteria bacterium]